MALQKSSKHDPMLVKFHQLGYCDHHQTTLKIDAFLSDEGFTKLAKHLREAGKGRMQKKLSVLLWEELTDKDLAKLAGRQHRTRSPEDALAF